VSEHRQLPTTLESYELEEVEVPIGESRRPIRAIRITIRGRNIFMRALEPIVRVGDTAVLYPRIQPDEQTIVGYLTSEPPEGAAITLQYRGQDPVALPEPFTMARLRRGPGDASAG
jgi:hypothetical protein